MGDLEASEKSLITDRLSSPGAPVGGQGLEPPHPVPRAADLHGSERPQQCSAKVGMPCAHGPQAELECFPPLFALGPLSFKRLL